MKFEQALLESMERNDLVENSPLDHLLPVAKNNQKTPQAQNRASQRQLSKKVKASMLAPYNVLANPDITNALKVNPYNARPGDLLLFRYDAKHKETLPLYDTYPLSFVLNTGQYEKTKDYYLTSLNVHYLTKAQRERMMSAINRAKRKGNLEKALDVITRLAFYVGYKVGIKNHLLKHIKGTPISIPPESWTMAMNIPSAFVSKDKKKKTQNAILRQARKL